MPAPVCDLNDMDSNNDARIRLIVVDDNDVGRSQSVARLRKHPQLEVVGDAGDCREAAQLTRSTHPDIVLVEIRRVDKRGVDVVAELSSLDLGNRPAIVAYLEILHRGEWPDARAAGADDVVLKEMPAEGVARELRRIVQRVRRDAPIRYLGN